VDYFYGMPSALASDGAVVFTPTVSPLNSDEARGEELLAEVRTILATTGAAKVNLIGHSQGGPTSRYVAAVIPNNVASVTTIDGVGTGTPVADIVLGVNNYGLSGTVVSGIIAAVATLEQVNSTYDNGYPINETASVTSLSAAGAAAFNASYPNGMPGASKPCGNGAASGTDGQLYFSWTGISQGINILDPLDPLLILASVAFLGGANDTMVGPVRRWLRHRAQQHLCLEPSRCHQPDPGLDRPVCRQPGYRHDHACQSPEECRRVTGTNPHKKRRPGPSFFMSHA